MRPVRVRLVWDCRCTACTCTEMVLTCLVLLPRSVLTVACEQTEVLLFDPISSKHIKTLTEAHEDCVNNIRWLSFSFFNHLRFTLRFLTAPPPVLFL